MKKIKLFHDLEFSRGVVSLRGLLGVFWGCSQLDFYEQMITARRAKNLKAQNMNETESETFYETNTPNSSKEFLWGEIQ